MRRAAMVAFACLTTAVAVGAGPATSTTQPTTTRPAMNRPATKPAATQAVVDAAARPVLEKLAAAYARPGPLRVTATLTGRFDVAGRARTYTQTIIGQADDAGRFRHDADPAGLLVNTGKAAYLYDRKRDAYAELVTAPGRQAVDAISPTFIGILIDENPALLLKHAADPAAVLRACATAIRLARPTATQPAGVSAAVGLVLEQQERRQTFWLNDAGEIVAATIDYTPMLRARQTNGVKSAEVALVYQSSEEKIPTPDAFAWRPPATAMQFDAEPADLMRPATAATRPTPDAATRPAGDGR